MESKPLLQLRNVKVTLKKGVHQFDLVLEHLDVVRGSVLGVVGSSGCGKTTLLDLLGLVRTPTVSSVFAATVNDHTVNISSLSAASRAQFRARHLGYVLQSGGLLPFLTARENIQLSATLSGRRINRNRIYELAEMLDILETLDRKPETLSGGQRQRVAIARALVHYPDMILADEPTAAVDKYLAVQIISALKDTALAQGAAVVMVTHDLKLAAGLATSYVHFQTTRHSSTHLHAEAVVASSDDSSCQ